MSTLILKKQHEGSYINKVGNIQIKVWKHMSEDSRSKFAWYGVIEKFSNIGQSMCGRKVEVYKELYSPFPSETKKQTCMDIANWIQDNL